MFDVLFYAFAALTLGPAVALVATRNTVHSAFLMIVSFLGLAGMFFLLEAYFLAVLQILVYAGAVVVLFLFVIMLLDIKGETARPYRTDWLAAAVLVPLLGFLVFSVTGASEFAQRPIAATEPAVAALRVFGQQLFTRYLLPMQIAGFLLLVAMIGVIVLSKKLEDGK